MSELGDRLREIRRRLIESGERLLNSEEIEEEVRKRRGTRPRRPPTEQGEDAAYGTGGDDED